MNKTIKVIYLLMMLLIVNTCVAFAQSEEKNTQTYNWQAFDIGPAEDCNYYTITQCKLNIEQTSICFGDESYYTKKDKFRWTDTPMYLTWITVSRDSIGGLRFIQIVEYARAHDDILTSRA